MSASSSAASSVPADLAAEPSPFESVQAKPKKIFLSFRRPKGDEGEKAVRGDIAVKAEIQAKEEIRRAATYLEVEALDPTAIKVFTAP